MELFIRCWLLSVSLFCCNVALILVINWSLLLSPMVDTHSGRYPVYCLWVEYRISAGHGFRGLGMLALRARQNPFTLSIHSGYASMDNRLNASCWWLCKRETCHRYCTEGWRHLPFVAYIPHKLKVECGLWSVIEPLLMKFLHSRTAFSHDSATFSRAQFSWSYRAQALKGREQGNKVSIIAGGRMFWMDVGDGTEYTCMRGGEEWFTAHRHSGGEAQLGEI